MSIATLWTPKAFLCGSWVFHCMNLQSASKTAPNGVEELLRELGKGEGGFSGTPFGSRGGTLDEFQRACQDGENPAKVPPGLVPQTVFWMMDEEGRAVGMMRVRHFLNERLLQIGGHVGYFVRRSERRKGYATAALRLAVNFLRGIGVDRVLVTVNPANTASIRVALGNGGLIDGQGRDPDSGEIVNRYWIPATP
jgi:predicted acetyltransferase